MSLKKIILTGGGTGGSVTPLLALVPEFKEQGWETIWVGTRTGVEKNIVKNDNVPFYSIFSGKFRRYVSIKNITDPILVFFGFFQSLLLLTRLQADIVMSAGGFVSVPVVWAAWCLQIPVIIHQQDIKPGLANRLMSACASVITVTFEKSLQDYKRKVVWVGNPVRHEFIKASEAVTEKPQTLPMLLVLGGGTGSEALNNLVSESLFELTKQFFVVHVTGNKKLEKDLIHNNYQSHSFLQAEEMADVMKQATLVITRAGLGTLTELSFLSKPTIIIPMPNSHQEDNAEYFQEKKAAVVVSQINCTPRQLIDTVIKIVKDRDRLTNLAQSIHIIIKPGSHKEIVKLMHDILTK